MSRTEHTRALVGIAALAVAVRLGALVILGPRLGVDSQSYVLQGGTILREGPLSFLGFTAEQSPLYSLLFAACTAVAGDNAAWAIGVIQALFGATTAVLIALFTMRMTHSPVTGLIAGAIVAVHITFVFWTVYVLTDTLLLFLLALNLWLIARLETARMPLVEGIVASGVGLLLVLTRRTNLLASVILLSVAAVLYRQRSRVVIGLSVPVLVVALAIAFGTVRSRSGSSLLDRGGAYAWQAVYMGLQWTTQGRGTQGVDVQLSTIPDDAERGAFYRDQSITWIRSDPGYFLSQAGKKFVVLWAPFLPEDSLGHKLISAGYLLPVYALGLIGCYGARRSPRFLAITITGVATFTLVCLITFVDYDQRYRLPAELFLIPLAAVGVERAISLRRAAAG